VTASRTNRWFILLVVSSALFLIVIDMSVLHTALPTLTRELGASASEKLWIMNAYALVVAGLLPGCGTLGDRVGHKRMFVSGLAVFGMASLVAAYSPTAPLLIGGRALLAVGAAMMMPATLSIIRLTFSDERERAMAIGLWGAVASGGAAVGPLIGGVLLEYFWWGSVFLINVPVAVAALVAALVFIPRSEGGSDVGWDLPGSLLILVGLVGLAFAIKEVAMEAPSLPAAASAAAIGALALGWFARRQRGSAAPLIDFSLFDNRGFRVAVLAALVSAFSVIGLALVLSQRLQLVLAYSPLHAALVLLPSSVLAFIGGPLSGWLTPRYGADRVIAGALLLGGLGVAGLFMAANAEPGSPADLSGALRPGGRRVVGGGLGRHHEPRPGRARRHGRIDRGSGHRTRRGGGHHPAGQHSGRRVLGDSRPAEGSGPSAGGARRYRPGVGGGGNPAG
jgi:DHA2 family multidrug resistance protein-like MFS transporter